MNANNYIQSMFAERIGGNRFGKETVIYKFEKIKRAKREAIKEFPDRKFIDLGIGEPDDMADEKIINVLKEEAGVWENRGYADNGIDSFKIAAADYMKSVYGVQGINAESEVIHTIGSKPALAMIPQAFINPGDIALVTVPGYPILATMTEWLGGTVYRLPLLEENNFLPDLETIPKEILEKAKLLYINYPNNPTGASATYDFYKKVISLAKENHIIVVQDAAYAALTFDGEKPFSFLSVEGAKEVGVEIHSLSKAYNMTGWRLGFLVGNELVIKAFGAVKENNDSGQFKAIQLAGKYALEHPKITEEIARKYSRRHEMLIKVLNQLGFTVMKPKASFYLYVRVPKGILGGKIFRNAEEFSQYLIREKQISTVPWDDVGSYIRISVTFEASGIEEEKKVIEEVYHRLRSEKFLF
ncbi:LL-diaminopimelate aminotransferase [Anaeromicropila herbilytica]|uniref:Aminotransferase n=1 Tax=Anaeromicropila herbilytica TaxID=2785025 RepID=A0A7R7EK03_9FIRM|nr:LL-diaminopimelate aminotransferase [Anaeromicropila herbilytica]BCN30192.1 aspartate aminotransferase [Anaeromicropila herbilytica]